MRYEIWKKVWERGSFLRLETVNSMRERTSKKSDPRLSLSLLHAAHIRENSSTAASVVVLMLFALFCCSLMLLSASPIVNGIVCVVVPHSSRLYRDHLKQLVCHFLPQSDDGDKRREHAVEVGQVVEKCEDVS